MPDAQHEDHQLVILDVIDHTVLAYPDAALTVTATKLDVSLRAWVIREVIYSFLDPQSVTGVDLAEGLRGRGQLSPA